MGIDMGIDVTQTELDAAGRVLHEGVPVTGEVVSRSPEGRVIARIRYLQGLEDGPSLEWYPDGSRRAEGSSRYGVGAVGVWRGWHPCGAPAAEYGFSDNGRLLFVRRWDQAGVMLEDKTY
ncbi:MAG TPA: hypothetical protein VGD67_05805 [Pseudonocardiaceae bacterium]